MCNPAKQVEAMPTSVFMEKLLGIFNGGALSMMLSIGHRTGLFDVMRGKNPASSGQIAEWSGLHERYVREWLGAMTTGGITLTDGEGNYWLPEEHSACLTRAAGSDNLAVMMQYVAVLGAVEDQVVQCFKDGGGVPYSQFKRFHEVMAEDSGLSALEAIIDKILPIIPGILEKLEQGIDVLDLGCGRGRVLNKMARHFPKSRFVGMDLSPEAIAYARNEAAEHNLKNIQFEVRDLTTWDVDAPAAAYDLVLTFDAVHDQARPDRMLRGIHKALRPGGFYLMQDIAGSSHVHENMSRPMAPFVYTVSTMHCMTVSLSAGGMGLGAAWGRQMAEKMLLEAGFPAVEVRSLEHDMQNDYYLTQKS